MIYNEYFTKGFQIFDGKKYSDQLDVSNIEWEYEGGINNDYHPASDKDFINASLMTIHSQIEADLVAPYFDYEIERTRIWEGVNLDVQGWHNHYTTHPNFFFLLYWSDTKSVGEGSVWFADIDHTNEWEIWPTPGTLIAVNNSDKFLHKVQKTSHTRILAEFYFDVDYNSYNPTRTKKINEF